ncbi:Protein of unknown function DUF490 [Richelia intracellularis]|nr:Protein of unknown function DUF490 [Richelia intracellularis]
MLLLRRGGIALGVMLSLGLTVGTWRLWTFIQQDLAPLAEEKLTTSLNRPVKLGKLEKFSLWGVKFASSSIPATPTDRDRVMMDGVEVGFNLWQLLFQRQLKLDVNLVHPDVYIQQDAKGLWVNTTLAIPGKGGLIKTDFDLDNLRITNGKLVLVPYQTDKSYKKSVNKTPVFFSRLNGSVQLRDNNQLVIFQVKGDIASGGNVNLWGEVRPQNLAASLQVQAQDLFIPEVSKIFPLPFELQEGRAKGKLKIKLIPEQEALMFGKLVVEGMKLKVPQVPKAFSKSRGNLIFQGMEIKLETVATNYGKIPLLANGMIHRQAGYQLVGKVKGVNLPQTLESLQVQSPVPITGRVKADLKVGGAITQPIISGKVTTIKPTRIDKVDFQNIRGKFEFFPSNGLISIRDIQGEAKLGGKITGGGILQLGESPSLNFRLVGNNLPGDSFAQAYNAQPPLQIGKVNATALLTGAPTNFQTFLQWQAPQATYPAKGETIVYPDKTLGFRNVELAVGNGKVVAAGTWDNQNWYTVAQAARVQMEPFLNPEQLQNFSLNGANVNGGFVLSGSWAPFTIEKIDAQQGEIKIGDGTVAVSKVRLSEKNFAAQLVAKGVRLGRILKDSHPALANPLSGTFQIAGNTENLSPKTLQGLGNARLSLDGGTVAIKNIQLASGLYKAQLQVNRVPLQQLAEVPEQFWGGVIGKFDVAGSVNSFELADIQASGEAKLNVAGGTAIARNIQLNNGGYQAAVTANSISAAKFNEQLRGKLGGKFQVTGTVDNFSLANVRAVGEADLSQGVAIVKQPLSAVVGWTGDKLIVERSTTPGLQANGYLTTRIEDDKIPEITGLALNVSLKNYNISQLQLNVPQALTIAGKTDFQGKITGTPTAPNIQGQLGLNNLVVNKFAFEPKLTGTLQRKPDGDLNLDVSGKRDQIALKLDEEGNPQLFTVNSNQASAIGNRKGNQLAIKVDKLPLRKLGVQLPPETPIGTGLIEGAISGDFLVNQQTWATSGELAIANPKIGRITGDRLQAKFNFANGKTTLSSSEFIKGSSKYAFTGNITQTEELPKIRGNININQGQIQDILTALQIFEIQDLQGGTAPPTYGTANDLKTQPVSTPRFNLLTQIKRFYEINALLEQQRQQRQESEFVPQLADLKGRINGEIDLDTTKNIAFDFKLNGENWVWENEKFRSLYNADSIIAEGSFQDDSLRLLPLRIKSENRLIAFSGNIGSQEQDGKLEVRNFPLDLLNQYINLPITVAGNLNATVALSGSVKDPKAIGRANITDGAINQKPLKLADTTFNYTNGRLFLGSTLQTSSPESVNITGSIPYSLPFATVVPESKKIDLDIQVKNEGIAVLNLFTDQIAFENGEGEIDIKVGGTWKAHQLNGIASLNNATFSARTLPGKLTQVTGEMNFDFDRIIVNNLQGNYSLGKVEAQGEIAITRNLPTQIKNPLTVSLEQSLLNIKGLYQGNASGNIQVTGSVLNPNLSGKVDLSNGRVILPENNIYPQSSPSQIRQIKLLKNLNQNNLESDSTSIRFQDLQLNLGKNIEITSPLLFKFFATGTLNVNGSLGNPLPNGKISLKKGNVNLFTTQLSLASGYQHQAIFTRKEGLNPYLDIRLFAKVLDVIQSTDFSRPNATGLAALETVRVEASVQGPANKLNENLVLRSTPARTETEIVTLLGGGFGQKNQNGDSTLALINIAGSAVFNNFQQSFNQIGNSLGLSELRIFPTIYRNPQPGRSNSSLELATEAGIDINSRFSASGIKILTTHDPIQWGVNYCINEEFRLRGASNFFDDNRAVMEFERRF